MTYFSEDWLGDNNLKICQDDYGKKIFESYDLEKYFTSLLNESTARRSSNLSISVLTWLRTDDVQDMTNKDDNNNIATDDQEPAIINNHDTRLRIMF